MLFRSVRVDVRIIDATHQNLDALVDEGRFREDLYHRLNVIRIHLPPLRERRADIPLLLRHFLKEASEEIRAETKTLRPEVEEFLSGLDWPGNVRQLENTCRWITVMAAGKDVHLADLPPEGAVDHDANLSLYIDNGTLTGIADELIRLITDDDTRQQRALQDVPELADVNSDQQVRGRILDEPASQPLPAYERLVKDYYRKLASP